MSEHPHIIGPRTYYVIFGLLMVLLVLTVLAAYIPSPLANIVIAISIATAKAVLIVLYFMHVRFSTPLTRVFAVAGFIWLVMMLGLILSDVTTRQWDRSGGSPMPQAEGGLTETTNSTEGAVTE